MQGKGVVTLAAARPGPSAGVQKVSVWRGNGGQGKGEPCLRASSPVSTQSLRLDIDTTLATYSDARPPSCTLCATPAGLPTPHQQLIPGYRLQHNKRHLFTCSPSFVPSLLCLQASPPTGGLWPGPGINRGKVSLSAFSPHTSSLCLGLSIT